MKRSVVVAVFTALMMMVVALVAVAAVAVTGGGSGGGAVGGATSLVLSPGTVPGDGVVFPGASGDVVVDVTNNNTVPVELFSLAQDGPITTSKKTCDPAWFTYTAPAGPWLIDASSTTTLRLAGVLALSADAGNDCESASVEVPLAAEGALVLPTTSTTDPSAAPSCDVDVTITPVAAGSDDYDFIFNWDDVPGGDFTFTWTWGLNDGVVVFESTTNPPTVDFTGSTVASWDLSLPGTFGDSGVIDVSSGPEDGTGTAFARLGWEDVSGFPLDYSEPNTFVMDTLAGDVACTSNVTLP